MMMRMTTRRVLSAVLACACALALVACLTPAPAFAYYNFGTVQVSPGASYVTVQAGQSTSTSITVNPASDSQTLGCGMAKCPQVCTSEGAIEAGYNCFDVNGQCTCAGSAYSTYYPEVSAASSNSGVATAYVSGNTLVVTGNAAGSATITVTASLRQWTTNTTSIQVEVTQPASGGTGSSGGSGGTGGGSDTPAAAGSGGVANIPQEAEATDSKDDELNETVIDTVAGRVIMVEANSYLNMADELAKIAGTTDQLVVWSGTSSERPDWSWTFVGDTVDASSPYASFNPAITVSELGTGDVSNLMKQARDGLVLEFAHEGPLPGEASVYVKADGAYADGTTLSLFCYNEETKRFELVEEGLEVQEGYVSFVTDHCSTWAFSTDDLTAYEVEEVNTPGAIRDNAEGSSVVAEESPAWMVPAAVAVIVAAVVVVAVVVALRRRKARANAANDESAAMTEAGGEGEGTPKEHQDE